MGTMDTTSADAAAGDGSPSPPPGTIAIVASAGGVEALGEVVAALPKGFSAAVLVLQHVGTTYRSRLVEILRRRARMDVAVARQGALLSAGCVFVAPAGVHLVVTAAARLSFSRAPAVHHVRPSADRLLSSLAEALGARAAAVVLTGTGVDGADGTRAIKAAGGTVIAQDEATSRYFGMPAAAIATGSVDQVLPLAEIPAALIALAEGWSAA